MSKTNIPSSVATFLTKTQSANNRKSKEVVLTIQEATDLSLSLSSLLNTQNELLKDIIELQKRLLDGPIEVIVDGGRS